MQADHVLMASAAVIVWGAIVVKMYPLRHVKRLAADAEALMMLLRHAALAAWSERRRWHECRVRARREW